MSVQLIISLAFHPPSNANYHSSRLCCQYNASVHWPNVDFQNSFSLFADCVAVCLTIFGVAAVFCIFIFIFCLLKTKFAAIVGICAFSISFATAKMTAITVKTLFLFISCDKWECVRQCFSLNFKYGFNVWYKSMIVPIWNRLDSNAKKENSSERNQTMSDEIALQNETHLIYSHRTYRSIWLGICQWIINYFVLHWIRSNCFAFDFLSTGTFFIPLVFSISLFMTWVMTFFF